MTLSPGEPAPWFTAPTPSNPEYVFDTVAGRFVLHAPILTAPRIFEPELCSRLIALHQETGGEFSGVVRDAEDRTVVVMDELKKRRDVLVEDADLQAALRERLERRLFPLIERGAVVSAARCSTRRWRPPRDVATPSCRSYMTRPARRSARRTCDTSRPIANDRPNSARHLRFRETGSRAAPDLRRNATVDVRTMRSLPPLLAALVLAGPAAAQTAITPGYWESTNKLLSPVRSTSVEKRCITPADVDKFMAGPSNRHYICTYPTRIIRDGQITLKGTCVSKKGQKVAIAGSGAYTLTSFNLLADVAVEFGGLNIAGKASTEAHRIGDTCPATPAPAG